MPALNDNMIEPLYYVLLFLCLVHIVYYTFYYTGLRRIKSSLKPDSLMEGVSVVIAARNEEENLRVLIPKILKQEYPLFEVIIVLNNTDDNSLDYIHNVKKNCQNLKIVHIDRVPDHINSKKYALTLGIKAAEFDRILLTDADCFPTSMLWITKMMEGYDHSKEIVLGFSPYKKEKGLLNLLIRFETIFTGIQYMGAASNGLPYMGVGRNLSYNKNFFLERNGFNGFQKITGGDDDLFVNKNGTKTNTSLILDLNARMVSIPAKSFRTYFNQKTRHLSVGKYYKWKDKLFLGIFIFAHSLFPVTLILSLILRYNPIITTSIFVIGLIPLLFNFKIFNTKSGCQFPLPLVIFLDVVFMFLYILVGTRVFFTKKIEWTT